MCWSKVAREISGHGGSPVLMRVGSLVEVAKAALGSWVDCGRLREDDRDAL